jgi:26S proteasome regulatory subunit N8
MGINNQIMYHVQEIVGLLPRVEGDGEMGKAFRTVGNDGGLVCYLGGMIRTVLALHDLSESGGSKVI